jgi:hypothetical protein
MIRHMRYWAATLGAAASGGFIAIAPFAFHHHNAIWSAFSVAILGALLSLAATALALRRDDFRFSGVSALGVLIAGFVIIATRDFTGSTAMWLTFAGGVALFLVELRALAMHQAASERVVFSLVGTNGSSKSVTLRSGNGLSDFSLEQLRDDLEVSARMRSWIHWLMHTTLGIAGTFVVLTTFAWRHVNAVPGVQPRYVWMGVGIAAGIAALLVLVEHLVTASDHGFPIGRIAAMTVAGAALAVSLGLVGVMAFHHVNYRWTAFALGAAMVGVSVAGAIVHEVSSERFRHDLEVAQVTTTPAPREVAEAA